MQRRWCHFLAARPIASLGPTRPLAAAYNPTHSKRERSSAKDQREKRLEQVEEEIVVDMPRPGLRHRPQSAGIAEGDALSGLNSIAMRRCWPSSRKAATGRAAQ